MTAHQQHTSTPAPDDELRQALVRLGLIKTISQCRFDALTGGVSSDIWKVETPDRIFCVKRALPRLRVDAHWYAPVERNIYEVAWNQAANRCCPNAAPQVIAHDEEAMFFVMTYFSPDTHRLWKDDLRDGHGDRDVAAECARRLVQIHSSTANDAELGARFPRTDIFHAIRLEPYLEATAAKHDDLREPLFALSERTGATRLVMIHGDVSPKNILVGVNGPVFLDAECACMGDPAFDLAFCLNHLLLKCLWAPASRKELLDYFTRMTNSYLDGVDWEDRTVIEWRAAQLLPGLLLARVDGKSPVEYITMEHDKNKVRRCARALLLDAPSSLQHVADAWDEELTR